MNASWKYLAADGRVICYLLPRPAYCDRGRWYLVREMQFWTSDADPAPRYYFDLERAKLEVAAYMRAKKLPVDGAQWVEEPSQVLETNA